MATVEMVLVMLLAVVASGYVVRVVPVAVPLPLVQIAMGAVIAGVFGHGVVLDPQIFFLLFLPPLLFVEGWRFLNDGLRRDKRVILELALGLVVFTVVGVGFLVHWLIPAMPLAVAFALAAVVSPTDPVALSSITAKVPIPRRLLRILEGESLLNDASGLVCFRFAVVAAMTGRFSLASASLTFIWLAVAGVCVGVGVTLAASFAQRVLVRTFEEPSGSSIIVSLLIPFGAYILAEALHASGILAAVSAGITMSYVELSGRLQATTRMQRAAVWDTVQFALNGVMFVLLGEQLPEIFRGAVSSVEQSGHVNPWWLAVYVLAINIGLAVLRFVWVWMSLRLTRHHGRPATAPQWRLVLATSLAGVRGAITLAGVLTLPLLRPDGMPFPARGLTIFLAAAVILTSLVAASAGLPKLLAGLDLPAAPDDEEGAESRARKDAAVAAIAAVESARRRPGVVDPAAYDEAATRVIAIYQHRLDGGDQRGEQHKVALAERELRLEALKAERETIYGLARERQLSVATSRMLVHEIDLLDSRYR